MNAPTIDNLERVIETGLEALRAAPLNDEIVKALRILVPPGYRPVVQLQQDRRKKRSTALASNWNPKSGEVFISFKPLAPAIEMQTNPAAPVETEVNEKRIKECCEALGDAERSGRQFVSLKWFRDAVLANAGFDWSPSADLRQKVLAASIDQGHMQTKKIPNPKSALHPTTVVSLIRTSSTPSRFQPIPISGAASASAQLIQDRG